MTTTTSSSSSLILYDIGHKPPVTETCFAPNPWKSRFALNFKGIPYTTTWVRMPDISKVRQELGQPAGRKFADGQDFFTLPILQDLAKGATLSDSFDIAVYLQRTYPDAGAGNLFPEQKLDLEFVPPHEIMVPLSERDDGGFSEYYRFNYTVDAAFSTHVPLMTQGLPLDPATAEETKAEFVRRAAGAGVKSWDEFILKGEAREKVLESFKKMLGDLAKLFVENSDGPFLLGKKANYADFIVGGWLRMSYVNLPKEEWDAVTSWHDGVFGQLWNALQAYAEVR
ncbi:hypothetical protein HDK77DRAFT_260567 [Phyllosticta capitalensis]